MNFKFSQIAIVLLLPTMFSFNPLNVFAETNCTAKTPCAKRSFSSLKELQEPLSKEVNKLIKKELSGKKSTEWKVLKTILNPMTIALLIDSAFVQVIDVLNPIYKKLSMNGKIDVVTVFKGNKKLIGRLVINTLKKVIKESDHKDLKSALTIGATVLEPFIYDLVPKVGKILKNYGV